MAREERIVSGNIIASDQSASGTGASAPRAINASVGGGGTPESADTSTRPRSAHGGSAGASFSDARAAADEPVNWSLRPRRLDEYIGQRTLLRKLRIAIEAARMRQAPMEHVLLHGPPGLGKTTLAHVIANEMGTQLHVTSGPAVTKASDLVGVLTRLQAGDVLFIDEIHRLPAAVEEFVYPAMEDYKIDVAVDSGMHSRSITLRLKPFTLIGATTRTGLISGPLRSRFGMAHHLDYYEVADLRRIAERTAALLEMRVTDAGALDALASRSRGTPRIANRLLRRVRDFALVENDGAVTAELVDAALRLEGVDHLGLDAFDRTYLLTIGNVFSGGPVGLDAVAATMNEDAGTLEDVVEPYLLQTGLVARTRRGRMLTPDGAAHVGIALPEGFSVAANGGSGAAFASVSGDGPRRAAASGGQSSGHLSGGSGGDKSSPLFGGA